MKLFDQTKGVAKISRLYWRAYGGQKGVLTSPYFGAAVLLWLAIMPGLLIKPQSWTGVSIDITSNLIGISLGAYAIILAFSDKSFVELMVKRDSDIETSPYIKLNATFVHFILIQILALLAAITCNSFYNINRDSVPQLSKLYESHPTTFIWLENFRTAFSGVSILLFIYAILLAIASTFAIFRIAKVYAIVIQNRKKGTSQAQEPTND